MVAVLRGRSVDRLLRADTILVVGVGNGICAIRCARQPAPLPCHRIAAIGGRIAVRVVTDVLAVVTRELIRPLLIGAVVPIGDRICRFLQRPAVGNIGVLLFGEQIPAIVIGINDRLIQYAVVLTGELVQTVVLVIDMVRPLLDVRDVPVCIVGILVRIIRTVLVRGQQRRLRSVCTRQIGERGRIRPDLPRGQAPDRIIGVRDRRSVLQRGRRRAVVLVVGVRRRPCRTVGTAREL